jgi:TfoX/Sxy family transcriptional regulator of competence genes
MAYDEPLLQRCLDRLDELATAGPCRHKNVFGMRGLLRGSRMFAAVGEGSIIVRLAPGEVSRALRRRGVRRFMPGGERLGSWVEVDDAVIADDPALRAWLEAGLRSLG